VKKVAQAQYFRQFKTTCKTSVAYEFEAGVKKSKNWNREGAKARNA